MSDKAIYIEEKIINSVKNLLTGRVNELLQVAEFQIVPMEFNAPAGVGAVAPILRLSECERSEKERIVKTDAYTLSVSLNVPEGPDSERDAYAYGTAIGTAVTENRTLGGTVDRAVFTGKKYIPPKTAYCGEGWQAVFTLRLTVEGLAV
jgi:hypothetical protein